MTPQRKAVKELLRAFDLEEHENTLWTMRYSLSGGLVFTFTNRDKKHGIGETWQVKIQDGAQMLLQQTK